MSVVKRLKDYIDVKGMNISRFEKSVGMSNASFGKSYKKDGSIGSEKLERILMSYDDLSAEWLMRGRGQMISSAYPYSAAVGYQNLQKGRMPLASDKAGKYETGMGSIPGLIPVYEAVSGLKNLFEMGGVPVSSVLLPDLNGADGALRIKGNSISQTFTNGDIIVYKKLEDHSKIIWGELYLLSIDYGAGEYVSVRYIDKSEKDGYMILRSDDPTRSPLEVPVSSLLAIAIVKANIRINTM